MVRIKGSVLKGRDGVNSITPENLPGDSGASQVGWVGLGSAPKVSARLALGSDGLRM